MSIKYNYRNQSCTAKVQLNQGADILAMFIANHNITILSVEV